MCLVANMLEKGFTSLVKLRIYALQICLQPPFKLQITSWRSIATYVTVYTYIHIHIHTVEPQLSKSPLSEPLVI